MLTPILILILVVLLILLLRWAFFVRVRVGKAPFCPVCREARGKFLGVGERTGAGALSVSPLRQRVRRKRRPEAGLKL